MLLKVYVKCKKMEINVFDYKYSLIWIYVN